MSAKSLIGIAKAHATTGGKDIGTTIAVDIINCRHDAELDAQHTYRLYAC
jgi:hypothetical protein